MILRATTTALGLAAAAVMLSGCLAPAPEPTPTSTAVFASEDEAFAAAEETYRAYNDAGNAWRTEPSSADPMAFLVGRALEDALDTQRLLDEYGVHAVGETVIEWVDHVRADPVAGDVVLDVCLNSSATRAINQAGEDVTPADRSDLTLIRISLTPVAGDVLIEESETVKGDRC